MSPLDAWFAPVVGSFLLAAAMIADRRRTIRLRKEDREQRRRQWEQMRQTW